MKILRLIFVCFSQFKLGHFGLKVYRHLVSSNRAPSTILPGSFIKFAGVCQVLKMFMRFGCNPKTIFVTFFAV